MRKEAIAPLLVLLMLLAAGGYIMMNDNGTGSGTLDDGDGNDNTGDEWDVYYVQSGNDLPACGSSTLGRLYYVADTAGFETCTSAGWAFVDLNGPAGPAGADGADGVNGTDGAVGANGSDGQDGADGTNGADGQDGAVGANGANGQDGADGANGPNGQDGADGEEGTPGAHGIDGDPGPSAIWLNPSDLATDIWMTNQYSDVDSEIITWTGGYSNHVATYENEGGYTFTTMPMPKGWENASTMTITVYWTSENADGDLQWYIGCDGYYVGESIGKQSWMLETETPSAADKVYSTEKVVTGGTGYAFGPGDDLLQINIMRSSGTGDTLTGDVYVLGVLIEAA